jgi:hypothetical protein
VSDDELITWLEDWYASHCDGEWEHVCGVKIDTLDNPGWSVTVSLGGTSLADREFDPVEEAAGEHDWLVCRVEDSEELEEGRRFVGVGDPSKLLDIIRRFRSWAEAE